MASKIQMQTHPPTIGVQDVERVIRPCLTCYEATGAVLCKIGCERDITTTLGVSSILYVIAFVTGYFSFTTLVYAAVLASFSLPVLYSRNYARIEKMCAEIRRMAKPSNTTESL